MHVRMIHSYTSARAQAQKCRHTCTPAHVHVHLTRTQAPLCTQSTTHTHVHAHTRPHTHPATTHPPMLTDVADFIMTQSVRGDSGQGGAAGHCEKGACLARARWGGCGGRRGGVLTHQQRGGGGWAHAQQATQAHHVICMLVRNPHCDQLCNLHQCHSLMGYPHCLSHSATVWISHRHDTAPMLHDLRMPARFASRVGLILKAGCQTKDSAACASRARSEPTHCLQTWG